MVNDEGPRYKPAHSAVPTATSTHAPVCERFGLALSSQSRINRASHAALSGGNRELLAAKPRCLHAGTQDPSTECPLVVSCFAWAEVTRDPHQNRSV
jgi:hypothetical protein